MSEPRKDLLVTLMADMDEQERARAMTLMHSYGDELPAVEVGVDGDGSTHRRRRGPSAGSRPKRSRRRL